MEKWTLNISAKLKKLSTGIKISPKLVLLSCKSPILQRINKKLYSCNLFPGESYVTWGQVSGTQSFKFIIINQANHLKTICFDRPFLSFVEHPDQGASGTGHCILYSHTVLENHYCRYCILSCKIGMKWCVQRNIFSYTVGSFLS